MPGEGGDRCQVVEHPRPESPAQAESLTRLGDHCRYCIALSDGVQFDQSGR